MLIDLLHPRHANPPYQLQHELGCVALAQKRFVEAKDLLNQERLILDELSETLDQHHRLFHIKLTNLTWLKKCAKSLGDDAEVRKINDARASLKAANKKNCEGTPKTESVPLQRELLSCRLVARQFALAKTKSGDNKAKLEAAVADLAYLIQASPNGPLHESAERFRQTASVALTDPSKSPLLLVACDDLRDVLRELGVRVNDSIQSKGGCENGGTKRQR